MQLYRRWHCIAEKWTRQAKKKQEEGNISVLTKRLILLAVVAVAAAVSGRLAVRAVLNLLLGGTMFGGNFL